MSYVSRVRRDATFGPTRDYQRRPGDTPDLCRRPRTAGRPFHRLPTTLGPCVARPSISDERLAAAHAYAGPAAPGGDLGKEARYRPGGWRRWLSRRVRM